MCGTEFVLEEVWTLVTVILLIIAAIWFILQMFCPRSRFTNALFWLMVILWIVWLIMFVVAAPLLGIILIIFYIILLLLSWFGWC